MKNLLILFLIMSLFSCCGKFSVSKSDSLTMIKRPFNGNQLRIDGYYYQLYNNQYFDAMIFYQDGTIITPGGVKESIEDMDNYITNSFLKKEDYKNVMYWWGVFIIDNNNISFEMWYPSEAPYKAFISEGKIINSTTFLITKRYRLVNGMQTNIKEINDEYHFKQFSPKPDSTNNFIK